MSEENRIDILGMGNAIVDTTAKVDDEFLTEYDIQKDAMNLVDLEKSEAIYNNIKPTDTSAGGSVANTIYSLAKLGVKTGFIGKISDDEYGKIFSDSIKEAGTEYNTRPLSENKGVSTSKCMVLVTPDAKRSMNTYLGASGYITAFDVDEDLIARSEITYLEGYLFDKDEAKKAFKMVADIAHREGKQIALTLSDQFCVERHHKEFAELIERYVDILFCNQDEIMALQKTEDLPQTMPNCKLVVITRGEEGVNIIGKNESVHVPADNSAKVVDLNGAGDAFAAGFLCGYVRKQPLKECAEMGVACATEVISHVGPRPKKDLNKILKKKGLIAE